MGVIAAILAVISWVALVFFTLQVLMYGWFTLVAWRRLSSLQRARAYAPLDEIFASPFAPGVSMLLPAYNEEACIVASAMTLLDLRYPRHEVIVVNDGSTEGTREVREGPFALGPVRGALRWRTRAKPLHGAYVSSRHRN